MEDWLQMIEDCEARESRLTEWESMFVGSIAAQLAKINSLSEKQAWRLEAIWERITEKG